MLSGSRRPCFRRALRMRTCRGRTTASGWSGGSYALQGSPPESNRYRSKRVGGLREAIAMWIPHHEQSTRGQASYSFLPHGDVVDEAFHRFLIAMAFVRGEGIH